MRWYRYVGAIVLLTLGPSLLILPLHLVHHWDEPSPECQILAVAVALDAAIPGAGCPLVADGRWQEFGRSIPCCARVTPAATPGARAPPR